MFKNKKNFFKPANSSHGADQLLIILIFIIIIFGLVSLSSASSVYSYNKYGDAYYFVKKQLLGLLLGIAAFIILAKTDYHIWRKYALGFLIFSVFLLVLVFIPGLSATYGKSQSWINILGFSLQPAEFVKLSFLIYLSAWLENKRESVMEFSRGLMPFLAVLGGIAFLLVKQPDIGTLFIIAVTSLIVFFIGGGSLKYIFFAVAGALVLSVIMISFRPYQLNRIKCVIDPNFDKKDKCYQINQSLIAIGSGGIFGRGLGASRQKYLYLPEVQGDFIFAVIAEEYGLIGGLLLVVFYAYFFYRGYLISKNTADIFGRTLAIGIVSWLIIQAFVNIGGVINLIPMTGVPLPFVSSGGSAILATLAAAGILVNISKQTKV